MITAEELTEDAKQAEDHPATPELRHDTGKAGSRLWRLRLSSTQSLLTGSLLVLTTLLLPITVNSCGSAEGPGSDLILRDRGRLPTWTGFWLDDIPIPFGRAFYTLGVLLALATLPLAIPRVRMAVAQHPRLARGLLAVSGTLALYCVGDLFTILVPFGGNVDFGAFKFLEILAAGTQLPDVMEDCISLLLTPLALFLIAWAFRSPFFRKQRLIACIFAAGCVLALFVLSADNASLFDVTSRNPVLRLSGLLLAGLGVLACARSRAWRKPGLSGWVLTLSGLAALFFLMDWGANYFKVGDAGSRWEWALTLFPILLFVVPIFFWYQYRLSLHRRAQWPMVRRALCWFYVPASLLNVSWLAVLALLGGSIPWGIVPYFLGLLLLFHGYSLLESASETNEANV